MNCPVCREKLIVVERQQVELDYCIICKGFWFDADELHILTEVLNLTLTLPDLEKLHPIQVSEKKRACPRCDTKMDNVNLGRELRVVVDRCPNGHGLWFDRGELGTAVNENLEAALPDGKQLISFLGEFFRYPSP